MLTERSRGERVTVAQTLAEPEDLSDGVLQALVETGVGDDSKLALLKAPPVPAVPAKRNW